MAEQTPKPTPVLTAQSNAPGIKYLAKALDDAGADGQRALQSYNEAVRRGPEAVNQTVSILQDAANEIGYRPDISFGVYAAPKPVRVVTPEKQAESSFVKEVGKSIWNSLVDTAAGVGRLPQVAFDASTATGTTFGATVSPGTQQSVSSKLQAVGDFTQSMLDHLKLDTDQSGKYDEGILKRGADGGLELNDLESSAHAIGSSLGFVASMMVPTAIAGRVGRIPGLIKAAQAAGDVERVAELTKIATGSGKLLKLTGGIVSQLQPLYQDAIDAGVDSRTAARFAAIVAPPVAALDAFTGIENLVGVAPASGVRKAVIREVLGKLGGEVTEASLIGAAKSVASKLAGRAGEAGTQFLTEAVTETGQEGYQKLVENLFDSQSGIDNFGGRGQDTGVRLASAGLLGGVFGAGFGAALHRSGAYHPTAFSVLQDAYKQEGKVGLQAALDDLNDGATSMARSGEMDGEQVKAQLGKMASVIQSFKNPYTVSPKTQFQFYDLNYNQLPDQQAALDELTARQQALTGDQPTDIDENGNPFAVDPVVAQREASLLAPQIADQQRRVAYLDGAKTRLAETGTYQDWGKGFDVIGKFQPGDRVWGTNADNRDDVEGTVSELSPDGQVLTVQPVNGGEPVEVRAIEARDSQLGPSTNVVQDTALGDVSIDDSIADGFQSIQQNQGLTYQPGQRVVLASHPDQSFEITGVDNATPDNPMLTVSGPDGAVLSGTLSELSDASKPNRVLGTYSPTLAMAQQDNRSAIAKRQKDLDAVKAKLPPSTITALDSMSGNELMQRYRQTGDNAIDVSERKYIEHLAERMAIDLNPSLVDVNAPSSIADDAPTVDPFNTDIEDISDEQWNEIAETDEVPDVVLADIAARLLDEVNLSERQQQIIDSMTDTEAMRLQVTLDNLVDGIVAEQATQPTDNGSQTTSIPESTDGPSDPIGSPDESSQGTGQIATQAAPTESAERVPDSAGPVRSELANEQSAQLPGESSGPVPAPAAPQSRPDVRDAVAAISAPATAPITDEEYKAFRQGPNGHSFSSGVLEGIAERIATGKSTTRDNAIYQLRKADIDPLMRQYNEWASAQRRVVAQQAIENDPDIKALDAESDELGKEIQQRDQYEENRRRAIAEDSTPSDEQIDQQLKKLAGDERASKRKLAAQRLLEPIEMGDETEIDDDFEADEMATVAAQATPESEISIGSVGSPVKVLLRGGQVTTGTIVGKQGEDIMVRRMNRQGTLEEDFPHQASSILSLSGKAISIDSSLPAYVAPKSTGLDATKLKINDRVVVPGATTPRIVAEVLSVNKDGSVEVKVLLSGATRTVLTSDMSEATTSELTQVKNKLLERADTERRSGMRQAAAGTGTPVGSQALSGMATRLTKAFPRIKAVLLSGQAMLERFGVNDRGRIENGTVYLNTDGATADTPVHEFAHAYVELMKRDMKAGYARGIELVAGSEYEKQVRATRPDLTTDEAIREEALVQAIGEKGVSILNRSKLDSFLSWGKLQLRRIGEKIGIPLSWETTLDQFATARASELLSGYKISDYTGEGSSRQGPVAILPTVTDESWLQQNGDNLDAEGRRALVDAQVVYDPATDSYTKQTVDQLAEQTIVRDSLEAIKRAGGTTEWLLKHANFLDQANLGRMLFGKSQLGVQFQNLLNQQLGLVAPMKVQGQQAFKGFYELLNGRTMYRGASTWESVDKWDIAGTVAGQAASLQIPVDIAVDIAAQYRTIITTKGHFDPQHRQKTQAGQVPTMQVQLPNVDDPKNPIIIELDKAQLRALEDRVFNQDAGTMQLLQAWNTHAQGMYAPIDRVHRLETGKTLDQITDYYPITTMASDEQILNRGIDTFVSDAGYFKDRKTGAPKGIRADGFLANVNRYQRTAEDYVQLTPLWQNLRGLAIRQKPLLNQLGYDRLHDSMNRLAESFRQPNGNSNKITMVGNYDIGKLLRLATLSRFAFNIAIPLKQTTGFFSAFGSGAIKAKYLDNELPGYLKLIGQSYALAGRGGEAGNYAIFGGGDTAFDEGMKKLRSIGSPDANVLVWRAQGQVAPDVFWADGGLGGQVNGRTNLNQAKSKLRSLFEEYGLSISQRADTAIVFTLFNAAEAQVRAESTGLTEQQILSEAASRAKEALYYSNQTFDQSDRAAVQFARNPTEQFLLLYKGQGIKIMNTMARRQIEVTQATTPDEKKAAQAKLRTNLALNAVLAPLITAAVDMAVTGLRGLSKPHDDRDDKLTEEQKTDQAYKDGGFAYLSSALSQFLPGELGEAAAGVAYMASNPESRRQFFDANAVGSVVELYTALSNLGVTLTTRHYNNRDQFMGELSKVVQTSVRATAVRTGVPMEATRQVNNVLAHIIEPDKKPTGGRGGSRHRPRERDVDYGIEYVTGTEEDTGDRRRRGR